VNIIRNTKDARRVYRDILQGYSYLEEENLYVKHFAEEDLGYLETLYKKCEKKLEAMGIESTKAKLDFLKKEDYWTQDEENNYINAKSAVADAYTFKQTLHDPDQQKNFDKVIKEQEEKLEKIDEERRQILYPTIETFCERKINEHYVRLALFKDKDLTKALFTEEEFKNLSYIELGDLVRKYNETIDVFTDHNIKRIAVNGFFLNAFLMSNNDPVNFYGKSVLALTVYQSNLYGKGKYYKSILEEGKEPPDYIYDQVEQNGLDPIVSWFETSFAQIQNERKMREVKAKQRNRGR